MRELPLDEESCWRSASLGFSQRSKPVTELKEDEKVSVFHMLGKFLYGKRRKLDLTSTRNKPLK